MKERKYGKHFAECTRPKPDPRDLVGSRFFNMRKVAEMFSESDITGAGTHFTKSHHLMVSTTHIHDCDEYLGFLGANIEDMTIIFSQEVPAPKSEPVICLPRKYHEKLLALSFYTDSIFPLGS